MINIAGRNQCQIKLERRTGLTLNALVATRPLKERICHRKCLLASVANGIYETGLY